jgi:hypothetical protein
MSVLVQINEYLDKTRNLSVDEINALIRQMDQTADTLVQQGFAHTVLGYMKQAELKDEVATFAAAKSKADSLKDRHRWLFVEPAPEVDAPEVTEVVSVPKVPKVKVEKKGDIAKRIYAGLADKSKENVMKVFQKELNTSLLGAQTYYYAAGGEKSGKRGRKANPAASTKVAYVRKVPAGTPTKRELAAKLFASAINKDRGAVVALFMDKLGMTKAGATTYAYTVGVQHLRNIKK